MSKLTLDSNGCYECRADCGACCIAPSIAGPLPGLPEGKPAGMRCPHLDVGNRCQIFGTADRPACCVQLKPHPSMCGRDREEALHHLEWLEQATSTP